MNKVIIAPSILGVPYENAPSVIEKLIEEGADIIHFDVMDGKFVSNTSFPIEEYKYIKSHVNPSIIFDVHLMVENVKDYVSLYIDNKADNITFHYEAVKENEILPLIQMIHDANIKVGISVKPDTDIKVLDKYLKYLDVVLIMSVEPGKGGQKFNENMLSKVSYLKEQREENNFKYVIEIDGGINDTTSKLSIEKGVNYLVAGSFILKADDYKAAIKKLR